MAQTRAAEGDFLPALSPGFWALCGLAAVVGGVMRSPLTGIVFTLELTHAWPMLLPLVIASVSAYALSVMLLKRSVLTEKIARRRLHLTREYTTDPLETFFAREVMTTDPDVLQTNDLLDRAREITRYGALYPVLDEDGHLAGVTTHKALLDRAGSTVADATKPPVAVSHPDDTLRTVVNRLALHDVTRAPVVERAAPHRVVGVITLNQLLHARRQDLHEEHHRRRFLAGGATTSTGQLVNEG